MPPRTEKVPGSSTTGLRTKPQASRRRTASSRSSSSSAWIRSQRSENARRGITRRRSAAAEATSTSPGSACDSRNSTPIRCIMAARSNEISA
jgi:hypothetical protein